MKNSVLKNGLLNALIAAIYIILVATLITNLEKSFENNNPTLGGIAFLLLFVISAAVMGLVIFGRPLIWYLDGKKKEAVSLVFYTLAFLVVIAFIVFFATLTLGS